MSEPQSETRPTPKPRSRRKAAPPLAAAPESPEEAAAPARSRPRKAKTAGKGTGRSRKKSGNRGGKKTERFTRLRFLLTVIEITSLAATVVTGIMVLLGWAAERFSGAGFFNSLLPFALGVLGLMLLFALLLFGWLRLRAWLLPRALFLPAALALVCALSVGALVVQGHLYWAFGHFRTLVGGRSEAARVTLTHQVFAAYRRLDTSQIQTMFTRAQPYTQAIEEAAKSFALDPDLLLGIAAAESSFLPRESKDGGQGLFQITRVPEAVTAQAAKQLGTNRAEIADHRHNGFLAAATLRHYLQQMKNDLFLGLLAYNIGPANGGLRFIMQQYGATDFVTIQPYLQQLPRDYPIRVLSHALAFRIHRREGKLLPYAEGLNAVRIQHIGVPGL